MNRTVLVVGTGRSGTSALAGVLHKLGVHMGDQFVRADENNRFGTFEEIEFFNNHRLYTKGELDGFKEWLPDYIERRSEGHEIWGIKEPLLVRTLPIIAAHLDEPIVIVIERHKDACIGSYEYAYSTFRHDAENWYDAVSSDLRESLILYDGPITHVSFDDLIDDPETVIPALASFVFSDMPMPADEQFKNAIEHVRPIAPRWDRNGKWVKKFTDGPEGWGNLAIGSRIAKHPEYHFFVSWTALLTGGLRTGDKVLMPRGWMPAHWAANAIMRDFLKTDKDSLFMIDDDMEFNMHDVERLRSNKDNWEYDVAFAFCTSRSWPPKPIVYRSLEVQPGPPRSLHGEFFDRYLVQGDGVVPVDAAGFAMTLFKRNVIEAMTNEYGPMHTFYVKYGTGKESEDIWFTRQVREKGFRICVDVSVRVNHIGLHAYGWDEYQAYLEGLQSHLSPHIDIDAPKMMAILEESMPYLSGDTRVDAEALLASIWGTQND